MSATRCVSFVYTIEYPRHCFWLSVCPKNETAHPSMFYVYYFSYSYPCSPHLRHQDSIESPVPSLYHPPPPSLAAILPPPVAPHSIAHRPHLLAQMLSTSLAHTASSGARAPELTPESLFPPPPLLHCPHHPPPRKLSSVIPSLSPPPVIPTLIPTRHPFASPPNWRPACPGPCGEPC